MAALQELPDTIFLHRWQVHLLTDALQASKEAGSLIGISQCADRMDPEGNVLYRLFSISNPTQNFGYAPSKPSRTLLRQPSPARSHRQLALKDPASFEASTMREDKPLPLQIKVRIKYARDVTTMMIWSNIPYRTLVERIDTWFLRYYRADDSFADGSVRLKYEDEDGDMLLIDSEEGVREAILSWWETTVPQFAA